MIVTLDYLIKLQYQGDNKLHQFKQTWLGILTRVRPEDVPSEKALCAMGNKRKCPTPNKARQDTNRLRKQ